MSKFLCYYELHVDDRTFLIHVIVEAETYSKALDTLHSEHGKHYHLQAKGVSGYGKPIEAINLEKYLTDPQKYRKVSES